MNKMYTRIKLRLSNVLRRKPVIATIIILICVIEFSYFTINTYYLRPKKWKEHLYHLFRDSNKYRKASDENIVKYVDCLYEKYHDRYGKVDNFPSNEYSSKEDINDEFDCMVEYLLADSLKASFKKNKELILEKLEKKIKDEKLIQRQNN